MTKHFTERNRRRREELGVTREVLAVKMGISTRTLARWELGESEPVNSLMADKWENTLARLERRAG